MVHWIVWVTSRVKAVVGQVPDQWFGFYKIFIRKKWSVRFLIRGLEITVFWFVVGRVPDQLVWYLQTHCEV